MTAKQSRSTMAEWLALHGLCKASCRSLLMMPFHAAQSSRTALVPTPDCAAAVRPTIGGDFLWNQISSALIAQLAELAPQIKRTALITATVFDPDREKYPSAFTLRDTGNGAPLIVCPVNGSATDILVLAHEFGHAVNYVCAGPNEAPPILRETCAFVCETLVLEAVGPTVSDPARALQLKHQTRYLGPVRKQLLAALDTPDTTYKYAWNYPPAKLLSGALSQPDNRHLLAPLFQSKITLPDLVAEMAIEIQPIKT